MRERRARLPSMNRRYAGRAASAVRSRREGFCRRAFHPHRHAEIRSAILLSFDALPTAPGSNEHRELRLCLSV